MTTQTLTEIINDFIKKVPLEKVPYNGFRIVWESSTEYTASVHTIGAGVFGRGTTPEEAVKNACDNYLRLTGEGA